MYAITVIVNVSKTRHTQTLKICTISHEIATLTIQVTRFLELQYPDLATSATAGSLVFLGGPQNPYSFSVSEAKKQLSVNHSSILDTNILVGLIPVQ